MQGYEIPEASAREIRVRDPRTGKLRRLRVAVAVDGVEFGPGQRSDFVMLVWMAGGHTDVAPSDTLEVKEGFR